MQSNFLWSTSEQRLYKTQLGTVEDSEQLDQWRQFDPWYVSWTETSQPTHDLEAVSALQALLNLKGQLRRLPVGVIGPREASEEELVIAEALGSSLGELGLQLICGGKNGVMQAAAKGYQAVGGVAIGLLPDEDWRLANDFIGIPIATGIGRARNAIIAQACPVLVAVGGGYGTLSEMAYGMQFENLVLAMGAAPQVSGVIYCDSIEQINNLIAKHWLS